VLLALAAAPASVLSTEQPTLQLELGGHSAPVRRLAVDVARDLVVTASDDKTAGVWELSTGRLRRTLRPPPGAGVVGRLYGAALHPREPWVAVGGTTSAVAGGHAIFVFDVDSGRVLRRIDARGGDVRRLLWSPDGALLVAAYHGEHGIRAFDASGRVVHEERFDGGSYGLAFSATGMLAATSMDGRLRLYRQDGARLVAAATITTPLREQFSVSFAPDGTRAVVGYTVEGGADVIEVPGGRVVARLRPPGLDAREDVRSVAWSADGRHVLLGGRDAEGARDAGGAPRFVLSRYALADGQFDRRVAVGRDTVSDLVPLADGATAFALLDGTWGVLDATGRVRAAPPAFADLRGAAFLSVSADVRRVAWRFSFGADPASFDFDTRVVERAGARDTHGPATRLGLTGTASGWNDEYTPTIRGTRVALAAGETSRALAFARSGDAFLGTSLGLYRIDDRGGVTWTTRTQTEVRAVNVSADARLVVTAMADGTLRWWRAADGVELLALFVSPDRRWIAWTPDGHFDAGAGADALVGWVVNRRSDQAADFYPFGRFRERFHHPGVIDRVLALLDVGLAVAAHERLLQQAPEAPAISATQAVPVPVTPGTAVPPSPPSSPAPTAPRPRPPPTVAVERLPPALVQVGPTVLRPDGVALDLAFALRASSAGTAVHIEVRVNGRPVPVLETRLPGAFDGQQAGMARITTPPPDASIQIVARDAFGYSEPLALAMAPPKRPDTPAPARAAAAAQQPRLVVLAVGVSEYQRREYNLTLAAKDARDFVRAMERQRGSIYRDVQTRVLLNRAATREAVLDGLRWLVQSSEPDDVTVLFLAGHGINAVSGNYYFIPHDGSFERLDTSGVPESAVRDALRASRGRTLFFVDTCHAGNVLGSPHTASRELSRLANSLASAENGVVVFASSTGRQNSEESDDWGNGAFTKAIVEGLAGKADLRRTGQVTFKGLDYFVSEEVRRLTSGRQTPVTIVPIGVPDFALARSSI
jgi:hypothetical protein